MDLKHLTNKREFLYHLTSSENLRLILAVGKIYSTTHLIRNSDLSEQDQEVVLRRRRPDHYFLGEGDDRIMIRDQGPISEKALSKCLTNGIQVGDFLKHLNDRVFFWPNLSRLRIHYGRYELEQPSIIRLRSEDVIALNEERLRLCQWNSGATRPIPYYDGKPPPRGIESFMKVEDFDLPIGKVAEVTFEMECQLPEEFWVGKTPSGPWTITRL